MNRRANKQHIFKSPEGRRQILERTDEILRQLPVAGITRTLATSFGETWLLETGNPANPPLLLLHGSSSNSVSWLGDIPVLSQNYRVLAVDIIGEAGHSAANRPEPNPAHYAEWIREILDGLSISRISLMGISFGGWLALAFATAYPERVSSLVLLAASGISPIRASFLIKVLIDVPRGQAGRERVARLIFGQDKVPAEVLEFSRMVGENFNPMVSALRQYNAAELKRLNMPVLYIGGLKDVTVDVARSAKRLKHLVPQSRTVVMPDRGHVIYDVLNIVMPFLNDNPSSMAIN